MKKLPKLVFTDRSFSDVKGMIHDCCKDLNDHLANPTLEKDSAFTKRTKLLIERINDCCDHYKTITGLPVDISRLVDPKILTL